MFFDYRFVKLDGEPLRISSLSSVSCDKNCYAFDCAKALVASQNETGEKLNIVLSVGINTTIKEIVGDVYSDNNEGYALEIIKDTVTLSAQNERGLTYAVSTLKMLVEKNELRCGIIFDYPDKAFRGYRVFIPGYENFDDFKKVVDTLILYKYNYISFEVGGAMEYKRHPEINEKWVEFCKEVHRGPYESRRIQWETHPTWEKNAIHADNGGGAYVKQEDLKELIEYCRYRGFEVMPEVPSLSHCDYLVMAHPEINERVEDTYPDTYCPSNPKSYELIFDVLDEICDVFKPKMVNIGHDEWFSCGICDNCKGKDPIELFVNDVKKISDYLESKGIRTIMWADQLLATAKRGNGDPDGGAAFPEKGIPAIYPCREKLPRNVMLIHWSWSTCDPDEEELLASLGYKMIFGNFSGTVLKNYRQRIGIMNGGFCSNWGSFEGLYMQRNNQNYSLISTAYTFWSETYNDCDSEKVKSKAYNELFENHKKELGSDLIYITHTTDMKIEHGPFYDGYFAIDEEWLLGYYNVEYADKSSVKLPVLYGYNINCKDYDLFDDPAIKEAIGASFPVVIDGVTYYKTAYKNPYPEKEIKSIKFEKCGVYSPDTYNVFVHEAVY